MIKRAPSRTQRTKGIKVKHVLQLCLLLGVCFWLIYQVKHSHDKKKEFDDKDVKVSVKAHSDDEILKLGRKDLPQVQAAAKNERHEDEEEDAVEDENKPEEEEKKVREREERDAVEGHEEANKHDEEEHEDGENKHEDEEQEEEENKNEEEPEEAGRKREEEEQEEESKNEETEDERRGGGDDELDEQDQERTEGEADREDEFIDEEKERVGEGDDDRESEVSEGEDKNDQVENENSLDDHDHEGVDRNTHVSREEHYTADDAASAVSHDNQIIISMTEKANSENSNENFERNVLEEENKSNTTDEISGNQKNMELKLGEGEMAESGSTLNATTAEEKDHGAGSYNSQEHPPLTANNTSIEEGAKTRNNSTGLSTELTGSSLQNGTETKLDAIPTPPLIVALDGATNVEATDLQTTRLEQTNNSDVAFNGNQFDSNTNISTKTVDADAGTGDSFNNSSPALSETFIKLNTTAADGEVSSGSSEINKTADTTQNETSNSNSESGGTIESSDSSTTTTVGTVDANSNSESGETNENSDSSSMNEIVEAAKEDLIDSSDSSILQDEKESRIYLGTLPDITAEVDNREEAAAE